MPKARIPSQVWRPSLSRLIIPQRIAITPLLSTGTLRLFHGSLVARKSHDLIVGGQGVIYRVPLDVTIG
jgi:hypothetical protein